MSGGEAAGRPAAGETVEQAQAGGRQAVGRSAAEPWGPRDPPGAGSGQADRREVVPRKGIVGVREKSPGVSSITPGTSGPVNL